MSAVQPRLGAALEYTQKILGGSVLEFDNTISVGTIETVLAKNNGDRVGLIICNLGGGNIFIAPDPTVSTTKGIQLSTGGSASILLPYDFTLTAREWDSVSDGAGPYNVYVLEYVRHVGA